MGSLSPFYCPDQDEFELGINCPSDEDSVKIELVTERFAMLLLGEDMSGGRKGVCTALAISNDIAKLSANVFGQLWRLDEEKKRKWRREMDWILCVSDFVIELVQSVEESSNGAKFEVLAARPRSDLYVNLPALKKLDAMLLNILDEFGDSEFSYVNQPSAGDENEASLQPYSPGRRSIRLEGKRWLPLPKLPPNGLSDKSKMRMRQCKGYVNQIHKASSAINNAVLADMEIPDAYLNSLPKSAKNFLGEVIYHNLKNDGFSSQSYLDDYLDKSSEHTILEVANRIEGALHIWRQKCGRHGALEKKGESSWGGMVQRRNNNPIAKALERNFKKYVTRGERAEALLQDLRIRFPDLPHTNLDAWKIQHNKDVGRAILEGYSRALESVSLSLMALIDDVMHVDDATKKRTLGKEAHNDWRRFGITIPKSRPLMNDYFSRIATASNKLQKLEL